MANETFELPQFPSALEDLEANRAGMLGPRQRAEIAAAVASGGASTGGMTLLGRDSLGARLAQVQQDLAAGRVVARTGGVTWQTFATGGVAFQLRVEGELEPCTLPRAALLGPCVVYCLPTARCVLAVEPRGDPAGEHAGHHRELLHGLQGLTPEHLALNARGRLASGQDAFVRQGSLSGVAWLGILFGAFFLLLVGGVGLAGLAGAIPTDAPLAILALGVVVGGGALAAGLIGRQRLERRLREGRVEQVRGPLRKRFDAGSYDHNTERELRAAWWIWVGERRFRADHLANRAVYHALVPGVVHVGYYEPSSGVLVAIVPG